MTMSSASGAQKWARFRSNPTGINASWPDRKDAVTGGLNDFRAEILLR